jgi:dynein assembly factor 1, axonemal
LHASRRNMNGPDLVVDHETGKISITAEYIRELCESNGQFATPYLNDCLFLHYKGFHKIENLDDYWAVKTLWLENNAFDRIENLEKLIEVRMLYLQNNKLRKVEGISHLKNLYHINLAGNLLQSLDGVAGCDNL